MHGFPPDYAFNMGTAYKVAASIVINELNSGNNGAQMKFNFSRNQYEEVKQPK